MKINSKPKYMFKTSTISAEPRGLFKKAFHYKETQGTIISQRERTIKLAKNSIKFHRGELEKYIRKHPTFQYSLSPIQVKNGPKVVTLMAEAAEEANVGPMAAVAGVLADLAVEEMIKGGTQVAVVENGGEASLASDRPIDVALQAGDALLSKRIGFRFEHFPAGIATSSGLYSHALSFGESEAVTIFAENAGIADAAATAVGNIVKGRDEHEAIIRGVNRALSIKGVRGAFILYKGMVGKGGEVPTIIGVNPDNPQ